MRVLVSFAGGRGHLLPQLPLARALRDAGHRLALSGAPRAVEGEAVYGLFERVLPDPGPAPEQPDGGTGTLERLGLDHERAVVGRWYAGALAERRAAAVTSAVDDWGPDLVVCDEMDFGAVVAAESAGVPGVAVGVIATGALADAAHVGPRWSALREAHGLAPDPGLDRVRGALQVRPFPVALEPIGVDLLGAAPVVRVRPEPPPPEPAHPAVAWLRGAAGVGEPAVHVTLGTIFNTESGDLFARLLAGLAALPVRVLATVGADVDPARLGVTPSARLRVERYVPQDQVLPHVALSVSHGGSGSVVGALAHGVPVLLAPMGADQELNAARVEALGVGAVVDALTATADDVRRAARALLDDPALRTAAGAIAEQVAALPPAASVVPRLESLVG